MSEDIGTVRWFGRSWNAPINDPRAEIPVPTGKLCIHCSKDIEASDSGVRLVHMGRIGDSPARQAFSHFHFDCWMNNILGPGWKL
jgi:hypothetical protein